MYFVKKKLGKFYAYCHEIHMSCFKQILWVVCSIFHSSIITWQNVQIKVEKPGIEPQTFRLPDSRKTLLQLQHGHLWGESLTVAPCDDLLISQYTLSFWPISYPSGYSNTHDYNIFFIAPQALKNEMAVNFDDSLMILLLFYSFFIFLATIPPDQGLTFLKKA